MMNRSALDKFIEYKNIELLTSGKQKIFLRDGKIEENGNNSIVSFKITKILYDKLIAVQGDTSFFIDDSIHRCEILHIGDEIKIKIFDYNGKTAEGRLDIDNSRLIKKQIISLEQLKANRFRLEYLFENKPIDGGDFTSCDFHSTTPPPNAKQKTAISYSVGVKDAYLIWGPPGTGKTSIIPSILHNFCRGARKRILICSYTNKAVDNVVQRLFDFKNFRDRIVRFGTSTLSKDYESVFFDKIVDKRMEKESALFNKLLLAKRDEELNLNKKINFSKDKIDTMRKSILADNQIIIKNLEEDKDRTEEKIKRLSNSKEAISNQISELSFKKSQIVSRIKELEVNLTESEKYLNELNSLKSALVSYIKLNNSSRRREAINLSRALKEKRLGVLKLNDQLNELEKLLNLSKSKLEELERICKENEEEVKILPSYIDSIKTLEIKSSLKNIYEELEEKKFLTSIIIDAKSKLEKYISENLSITPIHNKIEKLQEEMSHIKKEFGEKLIQIKEEILLGKDIILTTNMRICNKEFEGIEFDLVIMDEAGSIDLPSSIIPMLKTKRVIFVGDHKQLSPIVSSDDARLDKMLKENDFLKKSIFEILHRNDYTEKNETMLSEQYRMEKRISDFISNLFYSGKLEVSNNPKKTYLTNNGDPLTGNEYSMVYINRKLKDVRTVNKSRWSPQELNLVKLIVNRFRYAYGNEVERKIGIITPFSDQRKLIERALPNIACGTVHTFQGQEKSIIIFATTRYNTDDFGPLFKNEYKNLLNVAVSRASEKFIIIADKNLFLFNRDYYGKLYDYIKKYGTEIEKKFGGFDNCGSCDERKHVEEEACASCLNILLYDIVRRIDPPTIKTLSGHIVRSEGEKIIDDWMFKNNIKNSYEQEVKEFRNLTQNSIIRFCDWYLPGPQIFIELWGTPHKNNPRKRKIKEELYRRAGLNLLSLEQGDLKNLDSVLKRKLKVLGAKIG